MQGTTREELRELSRRSRRTQRWGMLTILAVLLLVPLQLVLQRWMTLETVALGVVAAGGLLFLRYAYVAGQERGEYRRIFARLKEERRQTRTLVPTGPAAVEPAAALVVQQK